MDNIELAPRVNCTFSSAGKHHFFGYYDKCPWSFDGKLLLSHEAEFIDRLPDGTDAARVGYFELRMENEFHPLAKTRAWNWQQGAMLQWLGRDGRRIIFNDLQDGRFVSVILDVASGEMRTVPFPVYAVHPEGRYALTVNFSRLDAVREGYGYKGKPERIESSPDDDGIWSVDLESGIRMLIASFASLRNEHPLVSMGDGRHWVDHLTFNPSGTKFAFLHRWETKGEGMHSRFCVADFMPGVELRPRILFDSGMASHFTWKNDTELLIWGRPASPIAIAAGSGVVRKFLLPVYHVLVRSSGIRQRVSGDAFLLFRLNDAAEGMERIAAGTISEDGHCSFSSDERWLMTDTYPDARHERSLLLFDMELHSICTIGKFHSLPHSAPENWDVSGLRCDLHPRFSRDGTQVCIDSVHNGSRQTYVLSIRELIENS